MAESDDFLEHNLFVSILSNDIVPKKCILHRKYFLAELAYLAMLFTFKLTHTAGSVHELENK